MNGDCCDNCGNDVHGQLVIHAVDPQAEGSHAYRLQFCTWSCVAEWADAIHDWYTHPVEAELQASGQVVKS